MKYIIGKYGCWLLALGCCLLSACSSELTEVPEAGSTLRVMPFTADFQQTTLPTRTVTAGYSPFTPDYDVAIGLFVWPQTDPASAAPEDKQVLYSNGDWHSLAKVQGGSDYQIFGYMPKKETIAATISRQTNGDIQLKLSNIDAVIADDVCFVTGVKDLTGDLLQGSFSYTGKTENNDIRLLMDHLFASVRFNIAVDEDYSALRTIKLKTMTISAASASATATITLRPNTTGADPVYQVSYSEGTGTASATFFESTTGLPLTAANAAEIKQHSCSFVPTLSNALTLTSTYDVYDKTGTMKIRANCSASNKLPFMSASRGECVTYDLTIKPTYLYQLSDPDLDNPTVVVN
jgi:hypothetical protein